MFRNETFVRHVRLAFELEISLLYQNYARALLRFPSRYKFSVKGEFSNIYNHKKANS